MRTAIVRMKSQSPYSQSKHFDEPEIQNEGKDEREKRLWRKRMHVSEDGFVVMPPMSFKKSLDYAVKYLAINVKGRGKATYTKHFLAGVMCVQPLVLPIKADEVKPESVFVPSDGKPGGSSRVMKYFPHIQKWEGDVEFLVFDNIITEDVFERAIVASGQFAGVGRFRPERGGWYGRFSVEGISWAAG